MGGGGKEKEGKNEDLEAWGQPATASPQWIDHMHAQACGGQGRALDTLELWLQLSVPKNWSTDFSHQPCFGICI